MPLNQTDRSETLPLTTAQLATHIKLVVYDSTYLNRLLAAAVDYAERETGRDFVETTWEYTIESFPTEIILPRSPVQSITKIEYYDVDNELQEFEDYRHIQAHNLPSKLVPVTSWPSTYTTPDAVKVTFVSGYEPVPDVGLWAIGLLVNSWYEQRADFAPLVGGLISSIPIGVDRLLNQLKVGSYQ